MKVTKGTKGIVMSVLAGTMAMSLTACGDLKGLLSSPDVKASIQSFLELYLGQEVNGQTKSVQAADVKAIRADGKPVNYEVGADGKIGFKDLPPQASELEIDYANSDQPVVMPIPADQKQDGKLIMRGLTRLEKGPGSELKVDSHYAGFDFDGDGQFDAQRPQFVQQDKVLIVHDAQRQQVDKFEAGAGGRFDLRGRPQQVAQGDGFFLPPLPLMGKPGQPGQMPQRPACGALMAKADGSIDLPRPDGTPRNFKTGEFELRGETRIIIIRKAGEPDMGKEIFMPCAPVKSGPMQPGQPGQNPGPNQPGPMQPGPMQPGQNPGPRPGVPACGALTAKADGSIDLPRADGTARNLKAGEFELRGEARMVIVRKVGESDTGKEIFLACSVPQPPLPL